MGSAAAPLHQTLASARVRLVAAGIERREAALDVDLFARTILGWDRAQLILAQSQPTPDPLEPSLSDWVARRERREPSAYIVKVREFWGLEFLVTPAVLIPRPETELVVEETLRLVAETGAAASGARLADIGTGSGCIAVALAHELVSSRVIATDVSAEALEVARENAERHGVAGRIDFVTTAYLGGIDGDFDLIAANPPYVRDRDLTALGADVRHEPHVALFGGETGLRDLEGVLDTAAAKLRRHGWLVMEFGFGQEDDVRRLVETRPALRMERVREDLQGLARTAVIQRVT
jgi:release factor glutamine methyltransferase